MHTELSGYRFMWLLVMFDLPVTEPKERKEAADFRKDLLNMGFEMVQFSVYMRFCALSQVDTYCNKIKRILPSGGNVNILQFTDKQYEKIITYYGASQQPGKKNPKQYELF